MTDIKARLDSIDSQLTLFKAKLDNNTYFLYELQIGYLFTKLDKIHNQLNTLEPNSLRSKRGLIDGLGSLIKSITGNLDHTDAEKYNNAIQILENNNQKLLSEVNDHISLNKEWMKRHSTLLTKIVENQERINNSLQLNLNNSIYSDNSLLKYAQFAQLLTIISENAEDLFIELTRIEDILAFIRASSTHHSMLSIENLRNMISKLKSVYNQDQVLEGDLREYYNIIKSGYYYAGKRIVIIFKVPIISPGQFDFYKLSLVPNKNFMTFIPPYPFLATNSKTFMYIEAECPKFNHQYLCEEMVNHLPRGHPDCIQGIIIHQSLDKSCRPTKVSLDKEAMEQLDDQHYTLIFPQPTKTELQCGRQEFITLHGSYLATLPPKCLMRTEEFTIININDQIKGQPLLITDIPYDYQVNRPMQMPHIKLNSINLKGLHDIEDKILMQQPIKIDHINNQLYHTTIPFYGILLSAAILTSIIIIRRSNLCTRLKIKNPASKDETSTENRINESPEEVEHRSPKSATFSLQVLK
ncbi:uncharacterized protein LOC113230006 [Hyposmocoma kahamanoa]|uniref:uncharacterized protein LOC113230006 n=1 Tax=Hyposmocoma kahamanoa TaxID=1477025 RepID=UPI000E6D66BF|nr:uncharacterized protein LOC113230006 [Hyposmocoma kahamanoa]